MNIKIFKRKTVFRKGGFHKNPNIGWEIILILVLFVVATSGILGFQLFKKISQEMANLPEESQIAEQTTQKEKIEKTLKYFSDRRERSAQIISTPAAIVDPSR